jgi:hypothetical protein
MNYLSARVRSAAAAAALLVLTTLAVPSAPAAELTKAQAIARVRSIISNNTRACSINRTNSITAVWTRSGWRVTANIVMSASGRRLTERAVWLVNQRNGATPQNQLTAELGNGC